MSFLNLNEFLSNLSDEEYIAKVSAIYHELLELREDKNYALNQPQFNKLLDIMQFFLEEAEKGNGDVEPVQLRPREEHGGITATFQLFYIHGANVERFCEVMKHASALSIDATTDGRVCISVTVPNIYAPIQ